MRVADVVAGVLLEVSFPFNMLYPVKHFAHYAMRVSDTVSDPV